METVDHFGVTDVAVVVTRYFGGILLGTGGLVRAYSDAALLGLKAAEVVNVLSAKRFVAICDYSDYELLTKMVTEIGGKIISSDYADKVEMTIAIPAKEFEIFSAKCTDVFCGKPPFCKTEDIFLGFEAKK